MSTAVLFFISAFLAWNNFWEFLNKHRTWSRFKATITHCIRRTVGALTLTPLLPKHPTTNNIKTNHGKHNLENLLKFPRIFSMLSFLASECFSDSFGHGKSSYSTFFLLKLKTSIVDPHQNTGSSIRSSRPVFIIFNWTRVYDFKTIWHSLQKQTIKVRLT